VVVKQWWSSGDMAMRGEGVGSGAGVVLWAHHCCQVRKTGV
jgi:hypothetical protein